MAYNDDELNKAVDQSSATLRNYQAANPVIANAARGPDIVTDPMQQIGYGGSAAGTVDLNATGASSPGLGQRIDERTAALVAARDTPTVANDVAEVRPSSMTPPGKAAATSGPIERATREVYDDGQKVSVPQTRQIEQAPLSVVPGIPDYKNEYAMMKARDAADNRELVIARAAADRNNQNQSRDYFAAIAAENATRGVYKPTITEQIVTNASTVAPAGGRGGGAPVIAPQLSQRGLEVNDGESRRRDLVQEEINLQNAKLARAGAGITQESERLKLEQQKRLNTLGSQLAAAADPKQRETLSSTILSLLGKDKPEEYQVIHAPGAESMAPDGMTKVKGADSIVILNKRTGAREVLQMGGQGQGGPDIRAEAQAVVAQGADKAKVNERLKAQGMQPI